MIGGPLPPDGDTAIILRPHLGQFGGALSMNTSFDQRNVGRITASWSQS